jgi:hypothetical protein
LLDALNQEGANWPASHQRVTELLNELGRVTNLLPQWRRVTGGMMPDKLLACQTPELLVKLQALRTDFAGQLGLAADAEETGLFEQVVRECLEPQLVWLIPVPRSTPPGPDWPANQHACGVIRVLPPEPAAPNRHELIVWVRGPYRNLGICRVALNEALGEIWQSLARMHWSPSAGVEDFTLFARYPRGTLPSGGERLERAMWLSFFYDFDFRRRKLSPEKQAQELNLIVEQTYNGWRKREAQG